MTIRVWKGWRVRCETTLTLPMSTRRAWGQLRDFHRYASHDHFHAGFAIEKSVPRAGAGLIIQHHYGPFHVYRVGRILWWEENRGYAYSDLSRRGPRRGFPHIMQFELTDQSEMACTLSIRVTGRWTAPTPRLIARLWLWWVMSSIARRVENDLLTFQLATFKLNSPLPAA